MEELIMNPLSQNVKEAGTFVLCAENEQHTLSSEPAIGSPEESGSQIDVRSDRSQNIPKNGSGGGVLINWKNMDEYSSIPIGYRFVDQAKVIPGKEAFGQKAVSSLDWFFKVHFPGNPIMPGVFVMEVMQQTGMLIVTTMPESETDILLFHSCESVRMYRSVRPGDMLSSHVVLESFRRGVAKFNGKVTVCSTEKDEEKTVCTMRFVLISEKDIQKVHKT